MSKEKQKKQQKNYFDMHENFGSVEELGLEMSRIIDAVRVLTDMIDDSKLPPHIAIGLVREQIDSYVYLVNEDSSRMMKIREISDLMSFLHIED